VATARTKVSLAVGERRIVGGFTLGCCKGIVSLVGVNHTASGCGLTIARQTHGVGGRPKELNSAPGPDGKILNRNGGPMTDETPETRTGDHDFRAITLRLSDLQRKCRSAGSNNVESLEMEDRLGRVLDRLNQEDGEGDPPPFAVLARELYGVERFFESNGFISIAKEVAHVERALEALASPEETLQAARESADVPEGASARPDTVEVDHDPDVEPTPARWAIPKPVAVVMLFFVAAIAVCAYIIYRFENPPPEPVTVEQPPTPVPTAIPPTPTPNDVPPRPTVPAPGAVLAGAVGQARLSLAEGDVDATIDHLSQAALIDPNHGTVLSTATQLVDRSNSAAEGGLWEIADLTLVRAERIAIRYGLDTTAIQRARRYQSRMDRFRIIRPSDPAAIRAASGLRVTVVLKDGTQQESIVNDVGDGDLLLNEDTTVRGGAMYYVERIPLADIDYLKVWDE